MKRDDLVKFSTKIPRTYVRKIRERASRRGEIQGIVIEALKQYLEGTHNESDIKALASHSRRLSRSQEDLARDVQVIGELLSLFVENWFKLAPELPEDKNERNEKLISGKARASNFFLALVERISEDRTVLDRLERLGREFVLKEQDFSSTLALVEKNSG